MSGEKIVEGSERKSEAIACVLENGEGALCNVVGNFTKPCGCRIIGNGTLPHPLDIKFCEKHAS